MVKAFIFLYPQEEIFQHEIERGSVFFEDPQNKEKDAYFILKIKTANTEQEKEVIRAEARKDRADSFRPVYSAKLNSCINWRYRKNGFSINYAVLDGCEVSDVIRLQSTDKVINVGMDAKTHRTKREDGTYPYPDQDYILNQLDSPKKLIVAGFHVGDCVERLAKKAYERGGINTLVDEDLTEFFAGRLKDRDFRVKTYPTYDARKHHKKMIDMFMAARQGKPWLWQEY